MENPKRSLETGWLRAVGDRSHRQQFRDHFYDSGQLVVISADGTTLKAYEADAGGGKLRGRMMVRRMARVVPTSRLSGPWEPGPIVGRIVHLDKDGKLAEVANDLHYANGIVIGPDGRLCVNNPKQVA